MKKKSIITILLLSIIIVYRCATFNNFIEEESVSDMPQANREFRAVWVATVDNIDWPSQPGLSSEEQKKEAIAILDKAVDLRLNAIVFQVRPHCDAFYKSNLEPWSYYLTGEQGKQPEPYYDPLEFWIDEAHKRGLELHAWFNPYRAHHPAGGKIEDCSIVKRKPQFAKKLKNGYYWLDPAKKETQEHSETVILDVVKRYDIDGVHLDDYFYPYPSYNDNEDFPDEDSWAEYKLSGGKLSRDDWRRNAVNNFVESLYKGIKKTKKEVRFGISPFGIWRPNYPSSIKGFDQYDVLYADARLWLHKGWIDYFTPQLYWPINQVDQSFPVLLGWWKNQNIKHRHLWPGLFTSKVKDSHGIDENINQIMITRRTISFNPGHVHFSVKAFMREDSIGFCDALKKSVYKEQALVPASPWLDNKKPDEPKNISIHRGGNEIKFAWENGNDSDLFLNVVYFRYGNNWQYKIVNSKNNTFSVPTTYTVTTRRDTTTFDLNKIAVSAVDKCGNESEKIYLDISNK